MRRVFAFINGRFEEATVDPGAAELRPQVSPSTIFSLSTRSSSRGDGAATPRYVQCLLYHANLARDMRIPPLTYDSSTFRLARNNSPRTKSFVDCVRCVGCSWHSECRYRL